MVARLDARATRHYFDSAFQSQAVKVLPNEYYVTDEDIMISTVLGSCVAACIHDPVNGVGGMNHFMLPEGDMQSPASATMRYGAFAMEVLINELLKAGAVRDRLEAKVFGGGAVLSAMQQMNIGERNGQFVLNYLRTEGIPVKAQDLGDVHARRINYFPRHGRVMVRKMAPHHQRAEEIIAKREQAAAESVQAKTQSPPRVERFARPGVERFDRPAARAGGDRPGVERFDRPGVERFDRPATRPGVERFDTGVTRRRKPETAGG
ncbi:chemoreceptor glutamine deamidase CheD [Achromobacter pulmonis]|uniref:chemoreceptor glutamine deamidase CheD n=1 Tax=Achromobacter pulmonis TaxID=1389932 RepID=UPI003C725939